MSSPFEGCAEHYLVGRPPYSAQLVAALTRELKLDGRGLLIDLGCGPGVLARELAGCFERTIGVDPDVEMLDVARANPDIEFRRARAEGLPALELPPARVVTLGQSFHWMQPDVVADAVWEQLEPNGAIVLVAHDIDARPAPPNPTGHPPIPHAEIDVLIARHLGPDYRVDNRRPAGWRPGDRYAATLARTRFGPPRTIHAPGRPDITRDVDGVVAGYLSMSYCAPNRFGAGLDAFVAELRDLLEDHTGTGRFHDWPGDTALIIGRRTGSPARGATP